jgi:hypothetical protein
MSIRTYQKSIGIEYVSDTIGHIFMKHFEVGFIFTPNWTDTHKWRALLLWEGKSGIPFFRKLLESKTRNPNLSI